ncbi:MAG: transposase [Candidatus Acidiferrales bacterium]
MATIRTRGFLPHWEANHAIYFVTFRLADSLPVSLLQQFEHERQDIIATALAQKRKLSASEHDQLEKLFDVKIQSKLDAGTGCCHLANPAVADAVAEALRHFDSSRYHMYAWCVMPNHVHTLFRLLADHTLPEVLHSRKSFSAKEANRLLGRTGEFWQREYYDHLVRGEEGFYRTVRYILENPAKAGLKNWRWVGTTVKA